MPDGGTFLTNPAWLVADAMSEGIAPPPPVDLNKWAREKVRFGTESPFPGRYNPDKFPFFEEILTALSPEDPCQTVALKKSAQLGGTVLGQIFLGGSMDLDPSPFLYVHPTTDNASRWSKQKWKPFLKSTTGLKRLFKDGKGRDGGSSILYQERVDGRGWLQLSGANSEAGLSMISVLRQIQDDLSKWETNTAGDPEVQADTRSKAFARRKVLKISTPLIMPGCRITEAYAKGTKERLFGPCPHCDTPFELTWQNFRDNVEKGTIGFDCPHCGGEMLQHHRIAWLQRARFVAEEPGRSIRSFYLWAAHSLLESWTAIAERWLAAKGNPEAEKTVLNDDFGVAFETQGTAPDWEALRDRPETLKHVRGAVPDGANGFLTLGCDVQGDRIEWALWAFTRDRRRYQIETGVIEGTIDKPEVQAALNALLSRSWPNGKGKRFPADMLAIDANYETDLVLEWVKKHPANRVIAVRGVRSEQAPFIESVQYERAKDGTKKLRRRWRNRFFNLGVATMKMHLYRSLRVEDPNEANFVGFPAETDDEVFKQITAEKRIRKPVRGGGFKIIWEKSPNQANEQLDMANYAEAAAIRLGWRQFTDEKWDGWLLDREAAPEAPQLDLENMATVPARTAGNPRKPETTSISDQLA